MLTRDGLSAARVAGGENKIVDSKEKRCGKYSEMETLMGERMRGGHGGWGRVRAKSIQTEVCVLLVVCLQSATL